MKKKIVAVVVAAVLSVFLAMGTMAAGGTWKSDAIGWWYSYPDGGYAANTWEYVDGSWYHFNDAGYMQTGWIWDGAWYFMRSDGSMATGWIFDGSNWYYLSASGAMYTGWLFDGAWYYLTPGGAMATGWIQEGNDWYYMNGSGAMQTGWLLDNNSWYYLDGSGRMVTGIQTIDGKTQAFAANGGWIGEQPAQSETVYITNSGSKYHRSGCKYLSSSRYPIDRNKAIQQGYTPCSVCNP